MSKWKIKSRRGGKKSEKQSSKSFSLFQASGYLSFQISYGHRATKKTPFFLKMINEFNFQLQGYFSKILFNFFLSQTQISWNI